MKIWAPNDHETIAYFCVLAIVICRHVFLCETLCGLNQSVVAILYMSLYANIVFSPT